MTITIDTLCEAWESAEVPTEDNPIRRGDTMIFKEHGATFVVWESVTTKWRDWEDLDGRILKRAPQWHPVKELADLQEENEWILQDSLSLRVLDAAWDNAEVPTEDTPIRTGDTLICKYHYTAFGVWECGSKWSSEEDGARILKRAPQPWQALADEMEALYDGYSLRAAEAAQFLHERGVRVVGGDES